MKESTKQTAESIGCRFTVFEEGSDPAKVEQAYRDALERGKKEGFWPAVVMLDENVADWLSETQKGGYSRESLIAGCGSNGKEILEERLRGYLEDLNEEEIDDFIGQETKGDVIDQFSSFCSFRGSRVEADTLLLEIPVTNPWEIIAWLPLGGWNDYPAPDEMMAVCKYWYEKYRAVPAAFTGDVVEFYAPCRLNGADSLEAAKEHYAFCSDRIDQGTRTYKVSELAAGLKDSTVWYFWWD